MTDPTPTCPLGFPVGQAESLVASATRFWDWMEGQTMAICDGWRWNPVSRQSEPTECADHPHGAVVYVGDLHRYLRGEPNRD